MERVEDQKHGSRGIITNIERLCTHDGPGSRTTVFFKGCPLRCVWCHNPETQNASLETGWNQGKCIGCLECLKACPSGALALLEDGTIKKNLHRCTNCGKCADICPAKAMVRYGRSISVADLALELEKDQDFFRATGGGVTLSGGEPLCQPEFAAQTASILKKDGIHVALDTCLYAPWDHLRQVLAHVDLVLADMKIQEGRRHKEATGQSSARILENLKLLAEYRRSRKELEIIIRTPLIPGYTMDAENIWAIDGFIHQYLEDDIVQWEMLYFHNMCRTKYQELGRNWELADVRLIKQEEAARIERLCQDLKTSSGKIKIAGLTAE